MNILITGGSSGLGKAIVELCALVPGNNIYFTYSSKIEESRNLEKDYVGLKAIKLDFKDKDNLEEVVKTLPELEIDVLINNAFCGNPQGTYIHKTSITDYEEYFSYNIIPTLKITQVCLEGMRKRKYGKIINILTSYLIDIPPTGFSVYTCTKAYIRQLSKSITKEYSKFNITSNSIFPDFMDTGFGKIEEFQREQIIASHPLKKILTPEEVAKIAYDLITSSQQLNGVEIAVNSGQHII